MPSSYTSSLRLTLPATGELGGQWGNTVNTGITELLDAAVAGTAAISTWGGAGVAYTLSNNSGLADEARKMFIVATGSPGEAKNVICPAVSKFYVLRNDTTGGFGLTLKTPSGTGISVPAGQYKFLYCDGTDVVEMFNSAGALTLGGALSVGGTATFAANPTLSAGTANQVQYLNGSKVLVGSPNMTFNGTDLTVSGAVNAGSVNATTLDLTNLEVTNIKAKDGTASASIADSTGVMSLVANPVLSGGTANGVLYLNGSKVATSGSALTFSGTRLDVTVPTAYVGRFAYDATNYTDIGYGGTNTVAPSNPFRYWELNGSEQMRLTSTGLGIGTSSPARKLDVRGSGNTLIRVQDSTGISGVEFITGAGTDSIYSGVGSVSNFVFYLAAAEQMRLTSTGLGIGTSSPVSSLTIGSLGTTETGSTSYGAALIRGANYTLSNTRRGILDIEMNALGAQDSGATLTFTNNVGIFGQGQDYVGAGIKAAKENGVNTNQSTYLAFSTNGSSTLAERMRLDSSGNLGIGTSSPVSRLTVQEANRANSTNLANVNIYTTTAQAADVGATIALGGMFSVSQNAPFGSIRGGKENNTDNNYNGYLAFQTIQNASVLTERMRLDSAGNLGIGTSSPSSFDGTTKLVVGTGSGGPAITLYGGNATFSTLNFADGITGNEKYRGFIEYDHASDAMRVGTSGTTKATLDTSGNLGLGVTPSAWSTLKAMQFPVGSIAAYDGGASNRQINFINNAYFDGSGYKYVVTDTAQRYTLINGQHQWHTAPSGTAGNAISFTQAMTLDASGNLVVGATSNGVAKIYTFTTAAGVDNFRMADENSTIASGIRAVGDAIVFRTQDTERARITSGGDLLVGTTNAGAGIGFDTRLAVDSTGETAVIKTSAGASAYAARIWNSATTGDNLFIWFGTEAGGTTRGSIDYNRAGGLTRYNTTSDYRAKDIIGPVHNPGATIDALKVYEGVMKGATQSRPMLIAHEAQAHAPYAVSGVKDEVNEEGAPKFQQMDVSSLVPLLLAEIQSLRARVAALEST